MRAIVALNLVDLLILVVIARERGVTAVLFALAGLFISVFYVAPPLRLKHRGLGEPGVAVVWGPLMIGGTYFVTTGEAPAWVMLASLPYALLVTTRAFRQARRQAHGRFRQRAFARSPSSSVASARWRPRVS